MGNDRLQALRHASGLTQAELACLVCDQVERSTGHRPGVDEQAISRLERGETTWPGRATRQALREILNATSDNDLGLYPKRTRRDTEKVNATNRRQFLAIAGVGLMEAVPRRIGTVEIDDLRSRFARLRDLDNYLGGADTFRLYSTELAHTEKLLSHGNYSSAVQRQLAELAAEQAQQTGWAAFDAGHTGPALQLFDYSRRAANEAGSESLAANALVHVAYATSATSAVDAANAACQTIDGKASPKTLALLESRRAWSYAVAQDSSGAARALDNARTILHQSAEEEAPHWSSWIDATELDIMTGRVWAVLREPDRSIPPLEAALAKYPDQWARDKALYLTWLADAYLDAGNAEQACLTIGSAIELVQRAASVRPVTRIRDVLRRLDDHRLPQAKSLSARLTTTAPKIPTRL